jgi:hypothetical protein
VLGCESRARIALRFIAIETTIAIFIAMNDNAAVKTFDDLEIHRPELARGYLQLLNAQPHRPIALFAPRRVGKTFFLENDLSPAAHAQGFITVYADLWLHKTAPLDAINHALEEALDELTVPATAVGKIAKTPVRKVGGLGASLEFGDEPKLRQLPAQPELRLDSLVGRLATAAGRRVLLMLDEIQALSALPNGDSIVATLRAVLQKRKKQVSAVFTGSSQEELAALVAAAGGPMYQFAQLLDFPVLDGEYLRLLANHFARVHRGKHLDIADLGRVFEKIGYKPALLKDLIKSMSAEGVTDVDFALQRMMKDDRQVAGWRGLLAGLQPLDREVLLQVAQGNAPLGQDTLRALRNIPGLKPTIARVRKALDNLKRAGILAKPGGSYIVEDRLFAEYLATITNSAVPDPILKSAGNRIVVDYRPKSREKK